MSNRHRFGFWAAALTVVSITVTPVAAGVVTVGDFLKDVATAVRLPATDGVVAEASLRAAGFSIPMIDRSAPLTEGAVAAISSSVGLRVTSGDPTARFDQRRLDTFMTVMTPRLANARAGSTQASRSDSEWSESGSGKGKKKPHSKSPKKPKPPKPPKT